MEVEVEVEVEGERKGQESGGECEGKGQGTAKCDLIWAPVGGDLSRSRRQKMRCVGLRRCAENLLAHCTSLARHYPRHCTTSVYLEKIVCREVVPCGNALQARIGVVGLGERLSVQDEVELHAHFP